MGSTWQCRRHSFDPWFGKIPHAKEQLSATATATEPTHSRAQAPQLESGPRGSQLESAPMGHSERAAPHGSQLESGPLWVTARERPPWVAARENPVKTQHSQN